MHQSNVVLHRNLKSRNTFPLSVDSTRTCSPDTENDVESTLEVFYITDSDEKSIAVPKNDSRQCITAENQK